VWEIEPDVDYWGIWCEVKKKLCIEFQLTEEDCERIITFCYGPINCAEETFPVLELPMNEVRRAFKRTIPKINELERLTRMRKRISDLDTGFMEGDDILVKKDGKWTNIPSKDYYNKDKEK